MSASFKNNASFVSRLPTIRRHKSTSLHSPAPHSKPAHRYDVNASAENLGKYLTYIINPITKILKQLLYILKTLLVYMFIINFCRHKLKPLYYFEKLNNVTTRTVDMFNP